MAESSQQAYNRGEDAGRVAGEIAARMAVYDQHFRDINGSVEKTAVQLEMLRLESIKAIHDMTMAIQHLTDQAIADARTREIVAASVEKDRSLAAKALETARIARKDRSETAWSPFTRGVAIIGAVATVLGIIGTVIALLIK